MSSQGQEVENITFFVKTMSGESHKMTMPADQKLIKVLRELEERNKNYKSEEIILVSGGKSLSANQNGEQTLEDLGVYENSSMIVVLRVPGGMIW